MNDEFTLKDLGPVTATFDGGYIINPNSTFPLTFYNITKDQAVEFKAIIDNNFNEGSYLILQKLLPFISKTHLKCKEIIDYIDKYKPIYLNKINELINDSTEWALATQKEREDLLVFFRGEAINSLEIQPSCNLVVLLEGNIEDISIGDSLLSKYGFENIKFFMGYYKMKKTVFLIPAGHYYRKNFDDLVHVQLAIKGDDIPIRDILSIITLKQMHEIVNDLNPPCFSNKHKASEFLLSLPNINERLDKVFSFNNLFKINSLPSDFSHLDLNKIQSVWDWEKEIINLIISTYSTGFYSKRSGFGRKILPDKHWDIIEFKDSKPCPFCKQFYGKIYSTSSCPSPPFHIGCNCQIGIVLPKRITSV